MDLRPCTYLYSRAWCFHQLLINQWKLWSRWWTIAHRLRLFHESQRLALRDGAAASHEDESQEADEEETHEDDEGEEGLKGEKKKKEEREKAEELARTGGFPELLKNSNDEVFNVNVMVKNKGFGVLWNGIGTLTIPDTGAKENSVNLARVVCAQRKALLLSNCQRLYPKMQKFPMEWAVQPFDDPYADPLDLDMILDGEYVTEMVPGNFQFLKKGRAVGPGA